VRNTGHNFAVHMARMLHGDSRLGLGAMAHRRSSDSTQARRSPGMSRHRPRPRPSSQCRRCGRGAAVARRPTGAGSPAPLPQHERQVASMQFEVGITAEQWVILSVDSFRRAGAVGGRAWRTVACRRAFVIRLLDTAALPGSALSKFSRGAKARVRAASVRGPGRLPRGAAQDRST